MVPENTPIEHIINQLYHNNPNAYFGIFAGGRLFIYNEETKEFTAHNNPNTKLPINSPLLYTELEDGTYICPMMSFSNLDELLDYIADNNIEHVFVNHVINITNQIKLHKQTQEQQLEN